MVDSKLIYTQKDLEFDTINLIYKESLKAKTKSEDLAEIPMDGLVFNQIFSQSMLIYLLTGSDENLSIDN